MQDGRFNSIITHSHLEIKFKVAVLQPFKEIVSFPVFKDSPLDRHCINRFQCESVKFGAATNESVIFGD